VLTVLSPDAPKDDGVAGGPSSAERRTRWKAWQVLAHEYIHVVEHPEFARTRRTQPPLMDDVLREGFAEMWTQHVVTAEQPKAASNPDLRRKVEGEKDGKPIEPAPDDTILPAFEPEYAAQLARAKEVLGRIGSQAAEAAFFGGHVEYLGLDPAVGKGATAVKGEHVVAGTTDAAGATAVETKAQVAAQHEIEVTALEAANPGIRGRGLVRGERLKLPKP
jgi:hypothetical protein